MGMAGNHLADCPVCPSRRAPCCVREAVPCWPSARCWPSSPSCCPVEPVRGKSAPWLATCRQQQASDGGFALWGGRTGFPQQKRCLQTLASAGKEANGPSLYQLPAACMLIKSIRNCLCVREPGLQVLLTALCTDSCVGVHGEQQRAGCHCTSWGLIGASWDVCHPTCANPHGENSGQIPSISPTP